jgi:hypothetical protein
MTGFVAATTGGREERPRPWGETSEASGGMITPLG